jgi:hypothetical protein
VEGSVQDWSPLWSAKWLVGLLLGAPSRWRTHYRVVSGFGVDRDAGWPVRVGVVASSWRRACYDAEDRYENLA